MAASTRRRLTVSRLLGRSRARRDRAALGEVRELALRVSDGAPSGSPTTERAYGLAQAVSEDFAAPSAGLLAVTGDLGFWTLFVLVVWLVVSVVAGATTTEFEWASPGAQIMFNLIAFGVIALGVWLLGAFLLRVLQGR